MSGRCLIGEAAGDRRSHGSRVKCRSACNKYFGQIVIFITALYIHSGMLWLSPSPRGPANPVS